MEPTFGRPRNSRLVGHFDDRAEADVVAHRHAPSSVDGDELGGWDVYELGVRGADGVTRDRRYPSPRAFA